MPNTYEGGCTPPQYIKGITYSLFGTISAFNKLQATSHWKFQYALCAGTEIALKRNVKIFPWDKDADLFVVFENPLTEVEAEHFRLDLMRELQNIVGVQTKPCSWWNRASPFLRFWHSIRNLRSRHTIHVEALSESDGYLDIFILDLIRNEVNHNDQSKSGDSTTSIFGDGAISGKLQVYHSSFTFLGKFWSLMRYEDASKHLPVREEEWKIYSDFKVNVPRTNSMLDDFFGSDWLTPNAKQWQLECPDVADETTNQWIEDIRSGYKRSMESSEQHSDHDLKEMLGGSGRLENWQCASDPMYGTMADPLFVVFWICMSAMAFMIWTRTDDGKRRWRKMKRSTGKAVVGGLRKVVGFVAKHKSS